MSAPDRNDTMSKATIYVVNVSDLGDDRPGVPLLPTHMRVVSAAKYDALRAEVVQLRRNFDHPGDRL